MHQRRWRCMTSSSKQQQRQKETAAAARREHIHYYFSRRELSAARAGGRTATLSIVISLLAFFLRLLPCCLFVSRDEIIPFLLVYPCTVVGPAAVRTTRFFAPVGGPLQTQHYHDTLSLPLRDCWALATVGDPLKIRWRPVENPLETR